MTTRDPRPILALAITLTLLACGSKSPPTDLLSQHVAKQLPPSVGIESIKCAAFASKQVEGSGRASCSGSLTLRDDLFVSVAADTAAKVLTAHGLTADQASFFLDRSPKQFAQPSIKSGATTSFRSELGYAAVVDGWSIDGSVEAEPFSGVPRSKLASPDVVIVGERGWDTYIAGLVAQHQAVSERIERQKGAIDEFFSSKTTIVGERLEHGYVLRPEGPLKWSLRDTYDAGPYEWDFWQTAQLQWTGEPTRLTCSGAQAVDKPVLVAGRVAYSYSERQDTESVDSYVRVMAFDATYDDYGNCHPASPWDGTKFVRDQWGHDSLGHQQH